MDKSGITVIEFQRIGGKEYDQRQKGRTACSKVRI